MPDKKQPAHKPAQEKQPVMFYVNIGLRVIHSLLIVGVAFLILGGSLALGIGAGYFAYLVEDTATPTKTELQKELGDLSETSKLTYADDSDIATISSDLLRTTVNSDQISDLVKKAIVATEDEYFYEHNGVVPKAVVRALLSEAVGFGGGGGSTLTQQLVKQQVLTSETTFKRKANEILLSMEVEKFFSKDEIVTMYLNVSPFGRNNRGENIAGVQEAAKGIFGKNANELSLPQAAYIAGLPQSPIIYSPYDQQGNIKENLTAGLDRKDFVLFSMYRNHDISKQEYEEAKAYDLKQDFQPRQEQTQTVKDFLYYAVLGRAQEIILKKLAVEEGISDKQLTNEKVYQQYLEKAQKQLINGGYTVKSTIDPTIYAAMQAGVAEYGYMLNNAAGEQVEVGNVMMDNRTGRILGFVGGRDYATNQNNHALDTERAAGSSIKPLLVYGPALDQGLIGSESRLSNYPTKWKAGDNAGEDVVNSNNKGVKEFQTVREALIQSTNITAYNTYEALKAKTSPTFAYDNYLAKMGYRNMGEWTMESAPLGPMNVSTVQQTNGFQTIANNGVYKEGYMIESITDNQGNVVYQHEDKSEQVYSPAAATITQDMMRSVIDANYTSPFQQTVASLNWYLGNADWIGKTGTSDNFRDSWLIVSTPNVTISSWSGIDDQNSNDAEAGQRNGAYMAYLVNRIYMANPDVFGINDKFGLDPSVKGISVSKATGDLPGKVTINGVTRTAPTEAVTSLWANGEPPATTFKFGIGGSDADYADYWGRIYGAADKQAAEAKKAAEEAARQQAEKDKETTPSSSASTPAAEGETTPSSSN